MMSSPRTPIRIGDQTSASRREQTGLLGGVGLARVTTIRATVVQSDISLAHGFNIIIF